MRQRRFNFEKKTGGGMPPDPLAQKVPLLFVEDHLICKVR